MPAVPGVMSIWRPRPMNRRTALTAAITLLLAGSARAAILAVEPFDYPPGSSVNSLDGGTGFSAPWANAAGNVTLAADDASLPYPANVDLAESGTRIDVTAAVPDPARATATRSL